MSKKGKKPIKDKPFKLPPHEYKSVITTLSQKQGWGIKQCNVPKTWTITQGEGETVMVIDTGWSNHSDLGENSVKGICTVDGRIDDKEGHGTHCAGIIAAKNNTSGMVGVAPKAKVVAVKALGDDGSGSFAAIAKALEYAIETKPTVISMSLGAPSCTGRVEKAIKKLYEMNIPIICAAGNDGKRGVDYPAKYPETIAVAAYDKSGNIANFSAVGKEVDWAAPGVNIYSTYLNDKYAILSGTSMACPFVAGIVALLISKHKKQEERTGKNDCKTIEQIKEHLLKYTVDKGIIGKDNNFGYGMLDVEKLIVEGSSADNPAIIVPDKPQVSWLTKLFGWFKSIFSKKS